MIEKPTPVDGELGEQLKEGIFKATSETTHTEDFDDEDREWSETVEHVVRKDTYTIISGNSKYRVVGGEDEARVSGTSSGQHYDRTDVYGASEPITKDGEYYLPWHVSAALTQSGKIEQMSREELVAFIEEAREIYQEGTEQDRQALEEAGGRTGYIQQKALEMVKDGSFGGDVEVAKQYIDTNWHNNGPHAWSRVISFANSTLETHVY